MSTFGTPLKFVTLTLWKVTVKHIMQILRFRIFGGEFRSYQKLEMKIWRIWIQQPNKFKKWTLRDDWSIRQDFRGYLRPEREEQHKITVRCPFKAKKWSIFYFGPYKCSLSCAALYSASARYTSATLSKLDAKTLFWIYICSCGKEFFAFIFRVWVSLLFLVDVLETVKLCGKEAVMIVQIRLKRHTWLTKQISPFFFFTL